MKIMTYNVQTGTPTPTRAANMINNILSESPDIVGTQEINTKWLYIFKGVDLFKTYAMLGKPRSYEEDVSNGNEYSAIFYKKELYEVIYSDTFWLSNTPEVISKLEGTAYKRIATYAVFERKTDRKRFMHVNTHVDYNSCVNADQIAVMLERIKQVKAERGLEGIPTFYTGDFNMLSTWDGYALMTKDNDDSKKVAAERIENYRGNDVIDYIFLSKNDFEVKKYEMTERLEGSDHDPVYLDVEIK